MFRTLMLWLCLWTPASVCALEIPDPLAPWVDWVMHKHPDAACAPRYDDHASRFCAWPGELELRLDANGGRFSQEWQVHSPSWVELPSSEHAWPQHVRMDGKEVAIGSAKGRPALRIPTGQHRIQGEFRWSEMPSSLRLPRPVGLLTLYLRQRRIETPHITSAGRLWLDESLVHRASKQEERLRIQVYRRVIDEIPMIMHTRMEIQVSGKTREQLLPSPMPAQSTVFQIRSDIPVRLENDGTLRLQLRPGRWVVELDAYFPRQVDAIPFPETSPLDHELWVWDGRPDLRQVEVLGLVSIDPTQTSLPQSWRNLPAYRIGKGDTMRLQTKHRGSALPAANELTLERDWWLDFDGSGYTFTDDLHGKMRHGWRLQMTPEMLLGRVEVNGEPRLITRIRGEQGSGVEVRLGTLRLRADGRYEGERGNLPAAGWMERLHSVQSRLHLPPGWRLLAIRGADANSGGVWLEQWTLLDLFLLLLATLATYRLYGALWGVVALLCLGLSWHETDAPRWIWLWWIAICALLHSVPEGNIRRWLSWLRHAGSVAWLVVALPFLAHALQSAIYPQIEKQPWIPTMDNEPLSEDSAPPSMKARPEQPKALVAMAAKTPPAEYPAPETRLFARPSSIPPSANESAKVQTGPGLPSWRWSTIEMDWHGPVDTTQRLQLWLLPPFVTSLWKVAMVLLTCLLAFRLSGWKPSWPPRWPQAFASLCLFLLLPLAWPSGEARADTFPPAPLLNELEKRLLEPAACFTRASCAHVPWMKLEIHDNELRLYMDIHAMASVAVPIPGERQAWTPQSITIDGRPARALYRDERFWIHLQPGVHHFAMRASLHSLDRLQIRLPLPPAQAKATTPGWQLRGIHDNGSTEESLQLTRLHSSQEATTPALRTSTLPPLLRLTRTLHIGLQWQGEYALTRLSPKGGTIAVDIPLLAGESVLSEGVEVRDGHAHIQLSPDAREYHWRTRIDPSDTLRLQASDSGQWFEAWRLDISPLWHAKMDGPPRIQHQQQGHRLPQWRPWPGESLRIHLTRPEAVQGPTKTLDSARLDIDAGERGSDIDLRLRIRSSQATEHRLRLPPGVDLRSVHIDGEIRPLQMGEQGDVSIPLHPGMQEIRLQWHQNTPLTSIFHTPKIDVGMSGVNADITLNLPHNRWILLLSGPALGPAVLFWGQLSVVLLVGLILGRTRHTPLRTPQWMLLGLGLSQVSVLAALLVVGWLFALATRRSMQESGILAQWEENRFHLLQVGLLVWTLLALSTMLFAVSQGLLGQPEMQIVGNDSSSHILHWYADHFPGLLPQAMVVSTPLWLYRLLMLAWSLWLALSLLGWLKWCWKCYTHGGGWDRKQNESACEANSSTS